MKKILLSLFAFALSMGASAQNLLQNGDFEEWVDGQLAHWVTASTAGNATVEQSENAHGGSYAALLKTTSSNKRLGYEEATYEKGVYYFSVYAKNAEVGANATICLGYATFNADGSINSNGYKYATKVTLTDEWQKYEYEVTLDADQQICPVVRIDKNTANALVDDAELVKSAAPVIDITNTPETAYTVAKAHELIEAGEGLSALVYVKGFITEIDEVSTEYGNATYKINDVAGETEGQLGVYRGKYIDGASFTAEDQIKVGDEVVVYGKLVNYNGTTHQFTTGSKLYSINGVTTLISVVEDGNQNASIYNIAGQRVNGNAKGLLIINGKKVVK